MQITDPLSNPQLIIEKIKSEVQHQLRAGSTVHAAVINTEKGGLVELKIGGQTLLAKTDIKITTGDNLLLSVIKAGTKPELAIIKEPTVESLKIAAMRTLMPKQASLQQLVNSLKLIIGAPTTPTVQPNSPMANQPLASPPQPVLQANPNIKTLTASTNTTWSGINQRAIQTLFQTITASTTLPGKSLSGIPASSLNQHSVEVIAAALSAASKGQPFNPKISEISAKDVRLARQIETIFNHAGSDKAPVTPERLRQALNQSGLLLESNLALGQAPTVGSLMMASSGLRRVAKSIRTSIGEQPRLRSSPHCGLKKQFASTPLYAQTAGAAEPTQTTKRDAHHPARTNSKYLHCWKQSPVTIHDGTSHPIRRRFGAPATAPVGIITSRGLIPSGMAI